MPKVTFCSCQKAKPWKVLLGLQFSIRTEKIGCMPMNAIFLSEN